METRKVKGMNRKRNQNLRPRRRAGGRVGLASLLAALAAGLVTFQLLQGQEAPDESPLDQTRTILDEYQKVQRDIAAEKERLATVKQMLEDRIELLQGRIELIEQRTAEKRDEMAQKKQELSEHKQEHEKLLEAIETLEPNINLLEKRVVGLLARMPRFVREDPIISRLSELIPEDPDKTQQSIGARYQNAIAIISQLNRLNQKIHANEEMRDIPGRENRLKVTVLYLGISYAYYVDSQGKVAGVGMPGPEEWVWQAKNDIAGQVLLAVKMYHNDEEARYVQLPVQIQESGEQN